MTKNKEKGFTLIELMIVIAIIGILAALAVPQFISYRTRSYNAAAKAVVHNVKADQANLNSELGIYGHTEIAPTNLSAPVATYNIANAITRTTLSRPSTGTDSGARVGGTRTDFKSFCVGIVLGDCMTAAARCISNTNQHSVFTLFSRHQKGDTAYGIDSAVEDMIYSVSNAGWINATGLGCTPPAPTLTTLENINGTAGGGAPYLTWAEAK
jgi:prepilin-type N-terminal cleavage/methylation domain-containing protein